jgi:hypothetical protein
LLEWAGKKSQKKRKARGMSPGVFSPFAFFTGRVPLLSLLCVYPEEQAQAAGDFSVNRRPIGLIETDSPVSTASGGNAPNASTAPCLVGYFLL